MHPKATTEDAPVLSPGSPDTSILLAEDSAIYRRLIVSHLEQWGFNFVCARSGNEAWKLLVQQDGPRLALLDWILPEIEGIEICRRLRTRPEPAPYTYTVLLTAKSQKHEMLEAMNAGADDFLTKPFDPAELKARLMAGRRIVELQSKLVTTNNELQFAASHDFLTRVWNRGEILSFLRRELARARRKATPVGLILVDVDHFKSINDRFGHQTGDLVLQELARRFTESLREYDGVGRYGGEEFLLIMPGCDLHTTIRRANEIRVFIASQPVLAASKSTSVTVSMGVSVGEVSEDIETLLHRTDAALYRAKASGRNRVEASASTPSEA
jgi:two-component system, cell cycle response regulator